MLYSKPSLSSSAIMRCKRNCPGLRINLQGAVVGLRETENRDVATVRVTVIVKETAIPECSGCCRTSLINDDIVGNGIRGLVHSRHNDVDSCGVGATVTVGYRVLELCRSCIILGRRE